VTEFGIETFSRLEQPANTPLLILDTELLMIMLIRLLHSENAEGPMIVTEFGILTLVRPVFLKASFSMLMTELGIVTFVKFVQP
jgi:hypothetical protein